MKATVSRRGFLKRSATAAVGVAAFPYIVPSSALGAGVAPGDRIALGFIGVGKQGRTSHVNSFRNMDEVEIVAVCDVESGRLEQSKHMVENSYAEKRGKGSYKGVEMYRDFHDLLARDDIDAVCIATPDHMHAIPCVEVAKAGKDIYCEKPLTRFVGEGRAVANAVKRYGRVFQTGSQQRSEYDGRFRRAAELVRARAIGELKSIDIGVGGFPTDSYDLAPEPVPETLDWDRWQGPAPWRPYNSELCPLNYGGYPHWRYFLDYAGGGFSDFGAHHYDIAQWALDMDGGGPVEIAPPGVKDPERMTFTYANGLPMYHGGEADCVFKGTAGTIFVSRGFIRSDPPEILDTPLGPNDARLGRGKGHRQDWLDCIRTRRLTIASAEAGHRTNTVCQLGNICNILKRSLRWDPEAERFVNDEEANRLLARSARHPWRL